jgi:hypothetical protein
LKKVSDEKFIAKKFYEKLGYKVNFKSPKTLNEKISALKLYWQDDLLTIAADKFKVRDYIKNKIGEKYLIPMVFSTQNVNDLKSENLPDYPIIIKTNHNSGGVLIVQNTQNVNWRKVKQRFKILLRENHFYSTREWQYKNIESRIVVEKLLLDKNGNIPPDYKLHCFNGKLSFVQVDSDRHKNHKRVLYDADWRKIPCKWVYDNSFENPKPPAFMKMKELAEIIAKDFIYVRVDLYNLEEKIFFGELTFHSESGYGKFTPKSFDNSFGELLDIKSVMPNMQ